METKRDDDEHYARKMAIFERMPATKQEELISKEPKYLTRNQKIICAVYKIKIYENTDKIW
jgi:hypothetical protein